MTDPEVTVTLAPLTGPPPSLTVPEITPSGPRVKARGTTPAPTAMVCVLTASPVAKADTV